MVECERVTSCGEVRVSTQALVVGLYRAIKAANGTCSVREAKIAARAIGATFSNTDAASWLSDVNAASDLPRSKSGRFEPRGPQPDLKAAEVLLDNPIEELQARARRFLAARDTGDIFDLEATVRNLLEAWDWGCVRLSASERQAIAKRRLPPERPGSVVKTIPASERR